MLSAELLDAIGIGLITRDGAAFRAPAPASGPRERLGVMPGTVPGLAWLRGFGSLSDTVKPPRWCARNWQQRRCCYPRWCVVGWVGVRAGSRGAGSSCTTTHARKDLRTCVRIAQALELSTKLAQRCVRKFIGVCGGIQVVRRRDGPCLEGTCQPRFPHSVRDGLSCLFQRAGHLRFGRIEIAQHRFPHGLLADAALSGRSSVIGLRPAKNSPSKSGFQTQNTQSSRG